MRENKGYVKINISRCPLTRVIFISIYFQIPGIPSHRTFEPFRILIPKFAKATTLGITNDAYDHYIRKEREKRIALT